MSIADRIQAINDHLIDDYKVLRLAGADLTGVNKNIVNLKMSWKERLLYFMNNGLEVVWNNWDKVSGTGTSITLNNTVEAPMSLTYKGNTLQNGTPTPSSPIPVQVVSGDNSIEVKKNLNTQGIRLGLYQIANGEYASPTSGNRYATFNDLLEVEPNTTYTITTLNNINAQFYQLQYDSSKTYLTNSNSNQSVKEYTFTTGATTKYLAIDIRAYDSTNITTDYVGGIQVYNDSFSASYPINLGSIELCKIGTYQDKIDKSTGKNLVEMSLYNTNNYVSQKLTLEAGTYYFAYTGDNANAVYVRKADGSTPINGTSIKERYNGVTINFTTNEAGEYYIQCYLGGSGFTNFRNAMLNEGTDYLPYEPYGTGWYLKKEIGKYTFTGNESWATSSYGTNSWAVSAINTKYDVNKKQVMCEVFNGIPASERNEGTNTIYSTSDTIITIRNTTLTTLSEVQSATSGKLLYYALATPTYETITDTTLISQLEALKKSYEGQTNISQVNNDLPFELDVTALSDGTVSTLSLGSPLLGSLSQPEETQEEPEVDSEESL